MAAIRILVVDDSVLMRRLLSDALSEDPALEVVDTATDGRMALAKVAQLTPDLVTLDIEMPVMDGLETLAVLRKLYPRMPIIMFSSVTARGAAATLDALALGASDYATKPGPIGGPAAASKSIRRELIPKIKALCGTVPMKLPARTESGIAMKTPAQSNASIEIVAIGTSTGGPNALAEVLPRIPSDFPVPIVVVQHMPPLFTRLLAERLDQQSAIGVEEGRAGAVLCPGTAWIAPGDFHMKVTRAALDCRLSLHQGPAENSCRPSVDVLFRSVAAAYGSGVLAVVMTGMGSDGLLGAQTIREAGGEVLVQDQASSVVWGMPGLVHTSGLSNGVYPLDRMGAEITRRVLQGRGGRSPVGVKNYSAMEPAR